MATTLSSMLFLGLAFATCGGRATHIRSIGEVRVQNLCDDPARCDVRGDAYANVLRDRSEPRQYLAAGQGPEQYLGKVAPERNIRGALLTCGAPLASADWLHAAPVIRTVKLDAKGAGELTSSLRSHLSRHLAAHPELQDQSADQTMEGIIDSALAAVRPRTVSMGSKSFWLSDTAFEKRVALCGDEEYENIVYSITLLELSPTFQLDLEAALRHGLEAAVRAQSETAALQSEKAISDPSPQDALSAKSSGNDKAKQEPNKPAPADKQVPAVVAGDKRTATSKHPRRNRKHRAEGPRSTGEGAPAVTSVAQELPGPAVNPVAQPRSQLVEPSGREANSIACAAIAHETVASLAEDMRLVAAVGFDNR